MVAHQRLGPDVAAPRLRAGAGGPDLLARRQCQRACRGAAVGGVRVAHCHRAGTAVSPGSTARQQRVAEPGDGLGFCSLRPGLRWCACISCRRARTSYWRPFALVWCADIGAYFTGRRFGHKRLAPRVSPGKTWEGVWGGLLLALVVLGACAWLAGLRGSQLLLTVLLVVPVLVMLSVFGDLFESVLKRPERAEGLRHAVTRSRRPARPRRFAAGRFACVHTSGLTIRVVRGCYGSGCAKQN